VGAARWRLFALWLSQVGRVAGDYCLRVVVVLELARTGGPWRDASWHLSTALLMLPAVLLAPFNGALSNSLPKRWVLVGSAAWCCTITTVLALAGGPDVALWAAVAAWALVAVGAAIYSPTRYALLPAAADDTGVPLTRVNGFIETGAVCAVIAGLVLGGELHEHSFLGREAALLAAAALNLLALVTALPVWFSSDVRRPEAAGAAVAGFFRDLRQVFRDGTSRSSLLGLAFLRGLIVAMTGALVAVTLDGVHDLARLLQLGMWVGTGVAAGSLLAGIQRHLRRALGLVPLGATLLLLGLLGAAAGIEPAPWLCVVLGAAGGLINVPLAAKYQASVPADARGNAMAVRNTAEYLAMTILAGLLVGLASLEIVSAPGQLWLIVAVAALGTAASWLSLFRNCLEQVLEWLIWPLYHIRGHGPGLAHFPASGPVLVVANHSSWFDPLWLGKVIPRRLTPMMTSTFYDLPGLRWWMRSVVGAIRVQASTYRREAPELAEAIRGLDCGWCVVIFPEGSLRRSEARVLRPFGQGVWHILNERPNTPVVVCWIEGGWGSFFSYFRGPPAKNKRLDFWRHIDIAAAPVQVLDPELLKSQRQTRDFLHQLCLETRHYLGLPPVKAERLEDADEGPDTRAGVEQR
jgi:1-acyl-sn-glycerol-3-phosphate acyltransferase